MTGPLARKAVKLGMLSALTLACLVVPGTAASTAAAPAGNDCFTPANKADRSKDGAADSLRSLRKSVIPPPYSRICE